MKIHHESEQRALQSVDNSPIQKLIPLSAAADWRATLDNIPHAFAHTWDNCYAMHLSTGYETYLYSFQHGNIRIACPIAERSFKEHLDILTPYGFSGFTGNGPYHNFPKYWKEFARRQGYVCGYIGLNPLLQGTTYCDPEDVYEYNFVYALDLRLELEELYARLSENRRRQLRNAEATTFVYNRDRLRQFLLENYLDFFQDRGASSVYHFAPETVHRLATSKNVFLAGVEEEGRVVALSLFAFTPFVGDYVLNVSAADAKRHSAALLWKGIQELKKRQVPWLNLGGGIRPDDGVAQFKKRFGGEVFPLQSSKQIFDQGQFQALCRKANAVPSATTDYFPPYRRR